MTRTGLVGLFLLPLAFAALPLAAMAVSASMNSDADATLTELVLPDQPDGNSPDVETLGFTVGDHPNSGCDFGLYGGDAFNES